MASVYAGLRSGMENTYCRCSRGCLRSLLFGRSPGHLQRSGAIQREVSSLEAGMGSANCFRVILSTVHHPVTLQVLRQNSKHAVHL